MSKFTFLLIIGMLNIEFGHAAARPNPRQMNFDHFNGAFFDEEAAIREAIRLNAIENAGKAAVPRKPAAKAAGADPFAALDDAPAPARKPAAKAAGADPFAALGDAPARAKKPAAKAAGADPFAALGDAPARAKKPAAKAAGEDRVPAPREARRAAPAEAQEIDIDLIENELLPELRKHVFLQNAYDPPDDIKNYNLYYMMVTLELYKKKQDIVDRIKLSWDDLKRNYGFADNYYRKVEELVRDIQYDIRDTHFMGVRLTWPYMPMFETLDFVFGKAPYPQVLPRDIPRHIDGRIQTEEEYKDLLLNGLERQLTDGAQLLTKAWRLTAGSPEKRANFFNNICSDGCIPKRNDSIHAWNQRNKEVRVNRDGILDNIYAEIYVKPLKDNDQRFFLNVAELTVIYQKYCMDLVRQENRGNPAIDGKEDEIVQSTQSYKELMTLDKVTNWIYDMYNQMYKKRKHDILQKEREDGSRRLNEFHNPDPDESKQNIRDAVDTLGVFE